MTHPRYLAAALLLAATTIACDTTDALGPETALFAEPLASLNFASTDPRTTSDPGGDLFDRLAGAIRGFGGLYRNGHCSVAVVLVDVAETEHAIRVVKAALEPNRGCPDGIRVQPVRGQFTYLELNRYLGASRPLLDIRGVFGISIDYKQNRLVITVASREVAQEVIDALSRLGIPERAVVFVVRDGTPTTRPATPTPATPARKRG